MLPNTCAGSRVLLPCLLLNFTTAYASKLKTTMNIAEVTISTRRDSSKIDWAGVDTGAKMLVGLSGGCEGAAKAASAAPLMNSARNAAARNISKIASLHIGHTFYSVRTSHATDTRMPVA